MELSNTLLVTIMFSTIVGLSIGGLLIALANVITIGFRLSQSRLFLGWALYLLLAHLSLFWDTSAITRFADWDFVGFMLILAGPMLLLLATHVLTTEPTLDDLDGHYLEVSRKFQIVFSALHLWILFVVFLLVDPELPLILELCTVICACLVCAFSRQRRLQMMLCAVVWMATLLSFLLL